MAGRDVLLARTGYTGEDGFEIFAAPGDAEYLWAQLSDAGAAHGLVPAGLAARDTLRLEAGMPLYGNELGADLTPFDAGLGRVVKLDKPGDFVGRRALADRANTAPQRQLIGLTAQSRRVPRHGYAVLWDGEPAGTVTSGAPSPTLGVPIARWHNVRPDVVTRPPAPPDPERGRWQSMSVVAPSPTTLVEFAVLPPPGLEARPRVARPHTDTVIRAREANMTVPSELYYTPEHEWVAINGSTASVGITDHAQRALGDVVRSCRRQPPHAARVTADEPCGEVESTKSVSDLYSPVDGEVTEVNPEIDDDPAS